MENIVVEPKWRRTTHGVVTMVNYVMEAKLASQVGAVRMMPITNVQKKGVEIINQVKCKKKKQFLCTEIRKYHSQLCDLTFFLFSHFSTLRFELTIMMEIKYLF